MGFNNTVKNEVSRRDTPCGYSKARHKKMVKKKQVKQITVEDIGNIGYGFGRLVKTFRDGFARGLEEEDEEESTFETLDGLFG